MSHRPLPYLLCQCLVLYLSNKFKNPMYSPKEISAYTLCYCSAAPFEGYLHQSKNLRVDKQINQQEGILAYKVINGTYLLNEFLNHGDVRHQNYPTWNIGDLRIPLYATTHSQLIVCYIVCYVEFLLGLLCSLSSLCAFKNKLPHLYLSLT